MTTEPDRLVKADGLAHGGLDVQRLHVLPVLLEQGDEEVDGQHDVGEDLVLSHGDVADGDTEAKDLLQLELDRGADLIELVGHVLSVGERSGELSSLGKTGTEHTGDQLDQGLGSQESVVLLGELLDKLGVPVQLLQIVGGHVLLLNLLSTIDVGGISKNADVHAGTGDVGELDGSRETLVPLGVVVLEANLQLDRFDEVALFLAIRFDE